MGVQLGSYEVLQFWESHEVVCGSSITGPVQYDFGIASGWLRRYN